MNDHEFCGHVEYDDFEVTELGMSARQYIQVERSVVPTCRCGWVGDECSDIEIAKFIWGNAHMGWSFSEIERWSRPMSDVDIEESRRRKQEIVDRFIWV